MAVETQARETGRNRTKPAEVLVIDVNEEHQMLSALALGRKGFLVTAANSAKEGLRAALSKPYDAIILDHRLKDKPALAVLEVLVERLPSVPKIFVVSQGAEDQAVQALGLGATGYLVKTARYNEILPAEVDDQIRKAATQAQVQRQRQALARGETERLQVEVALRETEERLHLLLEKAPFVLWTADAQLAVTSSLGSGLAALGFLPDEVIGKPLEGLFPGANGDAPFFEAHHKALEGTSTRFEQVWQRHVYDVHVGPLQRKGGPVLGVFGVALDITDRVRSERIRAALYRISEAVHDARNLQELFHSIHAIVGELMPARNFYIATHAPDSDTLEFPYFVDEEEAPPGPQKLGVGLTEYVLRTGRPLLASPEVFNDLVASGQVATIGPPSIDWLGVPLIAKERTIGVLVLQSYTEGIRYTESDRQLLEFVSSQIAIAIERKEAEDRLQENERFLDTLLGNLPGVAYRCRNAPDWLDEYVSEGIEDLLGYTVEEMGDISWGDLIHPDDRQGVWDGVQEAVKARQPYRLTYRIRTRQGQTKWVWEQGRAVYDGGGGVVALEGFITDVSPGQRPTDPE